VNGKDLVKRAILHTARLSGGMALSRALTRRGFNVIGFHGISLEDEHVRFPTLFMSRETFERRLRFLVKHYRVIALEEAIRQHRARRIEPNQVVLTFDDGMYNFLGAAIPILSKYKAPATIYVVTSDVESGEPAYNLLARDIILSTARSSARGLPHAPEAEHDLSTLKRRNAVVGHVQAFLQRSCRAAAESLACCRTLASALDVDIDHKLKARLWERLTPDEVRTVIDLGFDAQLHTHTHRNVVEHRQHVRQELRANRESLERICGRPAVHFCYPLGLWEHGVWSDLVAEGIESAVTTRQGPNYPETPILSLRRYLTGEAMTDLEFEFCLSGLRWLARAPIDPRRYAPSEKRVRYQDQPELY
jgi:peptidoglycan/xylan/chitin deacetylase (PgdA/CDA1 family)